MKHKSLLRRLLYIIIIEATRTQMEIIRVSTLVPYVERCHYTSGLF